MSIMGSTFRILISHSTMQRKPLSIVLIRRVQYFFLIISLMNENWMKRAGAYRQQISLFGLEIENGIFITPRLPLRHRIARIKPDEGGMVIQPTSMCEHGSWEKWEFTKKMKLALTNAHSFGTNNYWSIIKLLIRAGILCSNTLTQRSRTLLILNYLWANPFQDESLIIPSDTFLFSVHCVASLEARLEGLSCHVGKCIKFLNRDAMAANWKSWN